MTIVFNENQKNQEEEEVKSCLSCYVVVPHAELACHWLELEAVIWTPKSSADWEKITLKNYKCKFGWLNM